MKRSVPIVAGISRGWRWLLVGKQSLGSGSLGSTRLSSFSFIYLNVALSLPLAAGNKREKKRARARRQEDFLPADEAAADLGRFSPCMREKWQVGVANEKKSRSHWPNAGEGVGIV